MRTVAIIPARGGSVGVPGKNTIKFCGLPLIAYSIVAARDSEYVDEVYVTSDSLEILRIAKKYGAKTIKRPEKISGNRATAESALSHALDEIERKEPVDLVTFLQPTSPLRKPDDIDNMIREFRSTDCDSSFSAIPADDFYVWNFDKENGLIDSVTYDWTNRQRRQDFDGNLYLENGSIYVFKPEVLRKNNNRLGGDKIGVYKMEKWQQYEIDVREDIEICEYFMTKKALINT